MKLIYRGIPYETSTLNQPSDSPSKKTTSKSASAKESLRRPSPELTYRGIRYTP